MTRILILHGWGSSQKKWAEVKENIGKRGIDAFIPDLPGFGENPPPQEPWSVDDYVEWVKNYGKKIAPFFLFGHSFGGRIAIKFSVKYPEMVQGLILAGVPAIKSAKQSNLKKSVVKIIARFSFLPFYKSLRKIFYLYFLRKTDYISLKGEVITETFKKIISEDLSPYLPQIRKKTLILWGEKDDYVPLKIAGLIKEKISGSELTIFPGVKHTPYMEIPEKLSETILEFLNRN